MRYSARGPSRYGREKQKKEETMRRTRKITCWSAAVALIATVAGYAAASQFISIATGGTAGAYFPIGAGLADVINTKLTGYNASAQVTGASKINCINVNGGKSDLALVLGDTLAYAYKGDELGGFKEPLKNLRVVANIYPNTIQIVARKNSGLKTLSD